MENRNTPFEPQNQYGYPDIDDAAEISIKPLVRLIWSYRRVIAVTVSALLFVFTVLALSVYLNQPSERQASVEFRVLFEGADNGRYPNGLTFSRADIISTPVLSSVYEMNDLKRYCSYDEFKNRVFILESSRDLELLELDYRAKLGDTRLSAVDRSRLEGEFRQKADALRVAQYTLYFVSPGTRRQVPEVLMDKVLNDILSTWAAEAAGVKGALNYQVRVYTPILLKKDVLRDGDYLVRLDVLRDKVNRIIDNIDDLSQLPGATVMRVQQERISLPEIRANLEDIRRFRVEPAIAVARLAVPTPDVGELISYVDDRLMQVKLDHQQSVGRLRTLQDALSAYMREHGPAMTSNGKDIANSPVAQAGGGTITQLGESFLDRLVEISNSKEDREYRQNLTEKIIRAGQAAVTLEKDTGYYEDLAAALHRAKRDSANPEQLRTIAQAFDEIYAAVLNSLQQVDAVYDQLSKQNLNPQSSLYRIASPTSVSTQRPVTFRLLVEYAILTVIISLLLVPLACIIYHYFRTEIMPPRTVVAAKGQGGSATARSAGSVSA